jgi:FAD:protein FMN transferase
MMEMGSPKSNVRKKSEGLRFPVASFGFRLSGFFRTSDFGLRIPVPACLLLALQLVGADLPLVTWEGQTMGSTYVVKVAGTNLPPAQIEALKADVEQRLKEVNRQMSHYEPDSELSRFNRAPANTPFKVSPDFARVVRLALDMNRRSHGAFDPTLDPVINLWGFGERSEQRRVPSDKALAEALSSTGCSHLRVTANDELVKDIPGLQLNLSAIAKGFGSDEMARVLRSHGLTNFYVAISGETVACGLNAQGQKWKVGISAPVFEWRPGDPLVGVVPLSGQAISTSGDYQKFFVDANGRRWCHLLDPKTGKPVQHNLGSVSVVADNCTLTDALSTTLFVLGEQEGLKFIDSFPGAAALFVVRQPGGTFTNIPSARFSVMTGYKP